MKTLILNQYNTKALKCSAYNSGWKSSRIKCKCEGCQYSSIYTLEVFMWLHCKFTSAAEARFPFIQLGGLEQVPCSRRNNSSSELEASRSVAQISNHFASAHMFTYYNVMIRYTYVIFHSKGSRDTHTYLH